MLHLKNMIVDAQEEGGRTKLTIKAERRQKQQAKLDRLREEMTDAEKRLNDQSRKRRLELVDYTAPKRVGLRSEQTAVLR